VGTEGRARAALDHVVKRSGPPERRTPLRAKKALARGTSRLTSKTPLRRKTPLRPRGIVGRSDHVRVTDDGFEIKDAANQTRYKRTDRTGVPARVRAAVMARAGWYCEARLEGCSGTRGLAPHHRLLRRHAGPHTVEKLVVACQDCHTDSPAAIHRNPAASYASGLLVRSSDGPPSEPWERNLI
jgi:hypothetical protein